jgi:hypothetical protein
MRLICAACLPDAGFELGANVALPQYVGRCSVCGGIEPCSDITGARPTVRAVKVAPPRVRPSDAERAAMFDRMPKRMQDRIDKAKG